MLVLYFSQLANRSSALSTCKKGSRHPKGRRPQCLSTGGKACIYGKASNKGKRARQTDRRSPQIPPTCGEPTPQRCPLPTPPLLHGFQHWNTGRRPLCPNVAMRPTSLSMTQDPHSLLEQRGRGGRESLCPISNVRKIQTQSYATIKLLD